MIKYFIQFLLVTVIGIKCLLECPQLKPNPNVQVSCFSQDSSSTNKYPRRFTKCKDHNSTFITEIPVGTLAVYKCEKYYKPINRRLKIGTLNCIENGSWTNQKIFQSFYCEFDCGKQPALRNELIRGGNSTKERNWPWVATIFRQAKKGHFVYSCGGTLIGQKTVLTAAHCVTDQTANKLPLHSFRIILETYSSNFKANLGEGKQIRMVKEVELHPDYSVDSLTGDIAIIVLTEEVTFTDTVLPICFPRSYEHDALVVSAGNKGEISSFGIDGTGRPSKVLQHAYIPIQSSARCHEIINIIPYGNQFCAGDPQGPNICRGDSGSGLVFKSSEWNEEKYSIHGIVSSTGEVANGCAPMVLFTRVFSHFSWIQEKLISIENLIYLKKLRTSNNLVAIHHSRPVQILELYTQEERRALSKVRPLVKRLLLEDYMHTDEYLIRFLRTKKLNLQEALQMLRNTMTWRKVNRMNEILKEDFTQFRNDFPIFFQGFDKDGRPVFIYLVGHFNPEKLTAADDCERFKRYMFMTAELTETRIRTIGLQNITQSVSIVDFYGPNTRKLYSRCAILWGTVTAQIDSNYPQLAYLTYFINTSALVDSIMNIYVEVMSEYATSTFRVFGTNRTEYSQALLEQIPADQLFTAYGGTKSIKRGTNITQLIL